MSIFERLLNRLFILDVNLTKESSINFCSRMTDNFSLTRKHAFVFHTSSVVVHESNAIELARANTICAQMLSHLIIIVTVHTCTMVTVYGIVPWPECGMYYD